MIISCIPARSKLRFSQLIDYEILDSRFLWNSRQKFRWPAEGPLANRHEKNDSKEFDLSAFID